MSMAISGYRSFFKKLFPCGFGVSHRITFAFEDFCDDSDPEGGGRWSVDNGCLTCPLNLKKDWEYEFAVDKDMIGVGIEDQVVVEPVRLESGLIVDRDLRRGNARYGADDRIDLGCGEGVVGGVRVIDRCGGRIGGAGFYAARDVDIAGDIVVELVGGIDQEGD